MLATIALLGGATAFAPATTLRPAISMARGPLVAPVATPVVAPVAAPVSPKVRAQPPTMLAGLEGVGLVSALWCLLGINFMPLGPTAGMAGGSPGHIKWGDRTFLNLIEQAPIFLGSLWLHAVFVSASLSTSLGFAYLGFRLMYPVLWILFAGESVGAPFPEIFFSTFPQYGIALYMAAATVAKLGFGVSLAAIVKYPLIVAPVGLGFGLYIMATKGVVVLQKEVISKLFKA